MVRRRYRFVYGTDPEYGNKGLKFKDCSFNYVSGEHIAHDILEHFRRDASVEDEYRAFGAIIWLRGEPGYFRDWESHISASIADIWRHMYTRDENLADIAPRRIGGIDADLDSLMSRALEAARKAYVRDGVSSNVFADFKKNLPRIRNLIRSGYRKARQKYGRIGQRQMKNLSDELSRVADQAERACKSEGQEVDIMIDWKKLTVTYLVVP